MRSVIDNFITSIAIIVLTMIAGACATTNRSYTSGNADTLPPDFAQVLRNYETAWRAKDAAALAGLFAEDGFVLPNGHPPVRSRDAIQKQYEGAGGPLYLHAIHWAQEGSIGYIIGGYSHEPPPAPDTGKFTLTLRGVKQHPNSRGYSRWYIVSDMDNENKRTK